MHPLTAILLHGLCSTPDELSTVAAALRAAGHTVLPLTVPGYSFDGTLNSNPNSKPNGANARQHATPYATWLRTVANAALDAKASGQHVVLVGLSAGAALALGTAMMLAREAPRTLQGLVLMSTTLKYDGWSVPRHHFLMPLALYTPLGRFWHYREKPPYGVKNPRVRRWIERELAARMISRAGAAVIGIDHLREHDRLRRHVRARLKRFVCPPVLALHAREDEVAGLANVDLLRKNLRARSFRAVVLADSYHMITIDNDRHEVLRETLHFIDSLTAQSLPTSPLADGATS